MKAYVGLGANLGDPQATVEQALTQIAALPQTTLQRRSPLYRSAPVDAPGPDFINAVAALDTALPPLALLHALQAIEQAHQRERPFRNAPRTLDLDLLLYDDVSISTAELTLPHPRLTQRAFVLLPLLALAPDIAHPALGPLQRWLPTTQTQRIEIVVS